jgi:hypothetical protein
MKLIFNVDNIPHFSKTKRYDTGGPVCRGVESPY